MQLMINRLCEYCASWNLVVNQEKSKIMIFNRGRGRLRASENWHYNNERLEVVNEYKYLGVIFTSNLKMDIHFNEKLAKAKTAINSTWKMCFSNKYLSHSTKFKVFESVAESVMLYAAQVWGGHQYDEVEKLLRFYLKRAFRLPSNTPNYALNLETGLSPLFTKTQKLQADYVIKVLNMNESRLPKRSMMKTVSRKVGWYREWLELARLCNFDLKLEQELHKNWKQRLFEIISATDANTRNEYEREARESLYRSVYSRLNYNLQQANYFRDGNSVESISLMLRLRVELLHLNYRPHRDDLPILCNICNTAEREDVFHFVGKCPTLRETRRHFLGNDTLSADQVLDLLNEMNDPLLKFCKTALTYRDRIINASF